MRETRHLGRVRGWWDDWKRAFWSMKSSRTRGTRDGTRVWYTRTVEGAIDRELDGGGRYGEWGNLRQRASLGKGTTR